MAPWNVAVRLDLLLSQKETCGAFVSGQLLELMKTFLASKWCERIQIRKFDGKENPPDPLDAGVAKDVLDVF
ncbi:hypothetical protein DY000_02007184 [Brassica cretica]|uniref:Uncharacterized protein n=1 Tax=Brassica cretica TaxID=69181 RepID=A0ABQ7BU65_BRACR|nr:hypothetical protein DY000_02007184 [Brassica cretica]